MKADAGVAVNMVVVLEERGAERAGVLDGPEPPGERRAVLEGLEVGFAVGVVVGHVRPRMAARDTEVDQQLGDRLGGHRRAPVGCRVSWSRPMPWRARHSLMNVSASSPVSASATVQPTT